MAGAPPAGASEYAYLPPGDGGDLENRVLYDAREHLARFSALHRFGVYGEPGEGPAAVTAVGLRHEAEHAAQYDRHGRALFELESILRRAMRRARAPFLPPALSRQRSGHTTYTKFRTDPAGHLAGGSGVGEFKVACPLLAAA